MTRALRVLHLEDNPRDADLVRDRLDADGVSCEIRLTKSKAGFETALAEESFDLIISDYNLPGYDGISALQQAQALQPDVPVILVSGTVSEEEAVRCLQLGATDYLLKARLDRLASAVLRAIQEADTQRTRKRAEAAVREERDRAQRYLDTAEVILLKLDLEGRIELINRYGCSILGRTAEELIGRDWVETCVPPRIRGAVRAKLAEVAEGALAIAENPILSSSGDERLIEWRPGLIRDEHGRVVGTFSSGTDITERVNAVLALRAANERTQFVLQNANVGVWDMDYTTGVLKWSDTMEAQYGLAAGSFGGTFDAFVEGIHPDDRSAALASMGNALAAGADFTFLHRTRWPDATIRWLNVVGRTILDDQGEPLRAVGISIDVTERRKLEQQFHQAQKMEAIGQLAGGVAHDFNNLLTIILANCELMLEDRDPSDPVHSDLTEIQKAGLSAASLTRQLLAFSRQEIIEPTLLDLNEVLAGMRAMLKRLIREDVEIVLSLRPEAATIKADRGQIEQVVLNLAVNARDAMPKGGTLTIEIAYAELDAECPISHGSVTPGPFVSLAVIDTGEGMMPEVQSRLFEPFFTTKEVGRGTGLGLAMVHGIVRQNGGCIDVASELGKGTTLRAYFPRLESAELAAVAPPPVARARGGGETVLVVEDQEALRALTIRLLQRLGYTVLLAESTEKALCLFEQHPDVDLLLTDVVMPGGSGPDLTRRLRELRPDLKVIFMSGYTDDTIVQHGVVEPGIAFLQKPFTSDALGRKIREVLDS